MSLTKQDLYDIRTIVINSINESFELLSAPRFDALEDRMDHMESRMDRLETGQNETNNRLSAVERRLTSVENHLDTIEADIETVKNDVRALYELTGKPMLPALDKRFEKLTNEDKVRTLHAYTLKLAKQLNIQL